MVMMRDDLPPIRDANVAYRHARPGNRARERQRVTVSLREEHREALVVSHPGIISRAEVREMGSQQGVKMVVRQCSLQRFEGDFLQHRITEWIADDFLNNSVSPLRTGVYQSVAGYAWRQRRDAGSSISLFF